MIDDGRQENIPPVKEVKDLTEEQALRQIKRGSQEALAWFIDRYGAYVSAIIRGILGAALTESDVEETASDVFFSLWNNAEKVRSGAARPWLSAVARNAARDRLRRAVPEQPLPEDTVLVDDRTPETALTEKERTARVRLALLSLEPADREVFLRRYYYCQKLGDISREMGLNKSTVKSKLRRGREKLRAFLLREVPYDEVSEKGGTAWNTISTS